MFLIICGKKSTSLMSSTERVLFPLESAKLISSHSEDVSICKNGVSKTSNLLFEILKSKRYCMKVWKEHKLHPKKMTKETVDWIFLLDCLNFSFWVEDDVPPWAVEFEGEVYHGYWALCAGINRALKITVRVNESASIERKDFFYNINFTKGVNFPNVRVIVVLNTTNSHDKKIFSINYHDAGTSFHPGVYSSCDMTLPYDIVVDVMSKLISLI